jgi:hypothetical protein
MGPSYVNRSLTINKDQLVKGLVVSHYRGLRQRKKFSLELAQLAITKDRVYVITGFCIFLKQKNGTNEVDTRE